MHVLKSNLLARVSFGALAVAALGVAPAAAQTTIYGGGATLVSLVLPNLFACYTGNASTPAQIPPLAVPPAGCAATPANPSVRFDYASVGSGAGQRGWASQSTQRFSTALPFNKVSFASSEAALVAAQTGFYNNGGAFSSTGPTNLANQSDACVAPATGTGSDTGSTTTTGCFDNPRVEAGPAIQIPFLGTAVTVAFDPVYKRVRNGDGSIAEFRFQFTPRPDGSGGLNLSRAAFCGIFSGQIGRWNDAAITAANGGSPVWPDPTDLDALNNGDTRGRRIEVTVRDDDSGTTSLFTRALRAQCPAQFTAPLPAGFAQTFPGNPTPNSIPATPSTGLTFNSTCDLNQGNNSFPGAWVYGRGNEGVSFCVNTPSPKKKAGSVAVGGRIGYLSTSFVLPTVNISPFTSYALQTVDLENSSGNFVAPDVASTQAGLGAQAIPAGANRADPLNWVANPSGAVAGVSDPSGANAYPIVGTGNLLLYTCYVDSTTAGAFATQGTTPGFLNWLFSPATPTQPRRSIDNVLDRQGFVPLPTALGNAIVETFANSADPTGLNLYIRPVSGAATPAPDCTVGAG